MQRLDIIFLSSRGHKVTPKDIGIGLTVHQATRSKQLVQLLHAAGNSVNYDTVLRMKGPSDWTTSTRLRMSTIFEFQTSDVSRALVLHERVAHGMKCVCVVIM